MEQKIDQLASELRAAETSVAFTGAGISTPSDIPDFRSEGGIWEQYETRDFHIRAFWRDPAAFWERLLDLHENAFAGNPVPNPAHEALATLEQRGLLDRVLTQNADRLHQAAGSTDVIELHGNLHRVVCPSCHQREPFEQATERAAATALPPECEECQEPLKPDSVLFGEALPEHAIFEANALAARSDVFIVVGSSLTVEPAASLPDTAVEDGATLVIINLEPTPLDERADITFHEDVTSVLPRLAERV